MRPTVSVSKMEELKERSQIFEIQFTPWKNVRWEWSNEGIFDGASDIPEKVLMFVSLEEIMFTRVRERTLVML